MTKRAIVGVLLVGALGVGAYYVRGTTAEGQAAAAAEPGAGRGRARGGGGFGGGGFGGARLPMTVELASVKRADMAEQITVVGNLIGEATVETVPKVAGRLESVSVRLGDRVRRGQTLAKIEDRELLEQINQARASFEVSAATI